MQPGVERLRHAAHGLQAHGAGHIGNLRQILRIVQRQRGHCRHDSRAVDQADPLLGLQDERPQTRHL